ncbi:peptidase [Peromfec virus RodF8_9]|uniref:Peptidase n=1 Tax=Peromfec virus RodF8_9 TaxID=2929390 RepID=A0A976R7S4_9VIRU|nr:peptidase [Peromfec virus RodF8_9]
MNDATIIQYFKPSEFFVSSTAKSLGIDNTPTDWDTYCNIYLLAFYLDAVRSRYSKPITLNSGYRCPTLNVAVGGVSNSRHLQGLAVDISCLHNQDYEKIYQIVSKDCRYIHYYPDRHYIHVDFTREFLISFYNQNQESL